MLVMILEDDSWIADLLKQIVLSLRPAARWYAWTTSAPPCTNGSNARPTWSSATGTCRTAPAPACWNRFARQQQHAAGVITGRSDRASVLAVRALKINAFISKPFQAAHVAASLETLLPPDD